MNQSFNLIPRSRCCSQVLTSILLDQHIILDTHTTDIPVLLQNTLVHEFGELLLLESGLDDKAAEVDARLDGDDGVGRNGTSDAEVAEHGIGVFVVCIAAAVVCVHAEIVSEAVREEKSRDATVEEFLLVAASQDTEATKAVDGDLMGESVKVLPGDVGLQCLHAFGLHLVDNIIDFTALLCEFALKRIGAGDI